MNLFFSSGNAKDSVFDAVATYLQSLHLTVTAMDQDRPWGGFFVIDEGDAEKFINRFFPNLEKKEIHKGQKLSPKILIVAPQKRLSWQYHHRRAELWKLIGGTAGLVQSDTDHEKEVTYIALGEIIHLKQGERHRLIGLKDWGIVAEIWQHTNAEHPSDENDIVRLQDDFGR